MPSQKSKTVKDLDMLAAYTGTRGIAGIRDRQRARACMLNHLQLDANYSGAVDCQVWQKRVMLCRQTRQFLYTQFTPTATRYQRGTRPVLEQTVARLTADAAGETDRMLALMRFCRDLYQTAASGAHEPAYVYGGTEEQLIEKGEELCECLGRLLVALCEVAGLPARMVMHVIGGHIATEIHVEGGWAYVDPRAGLFCRKADGGPASTWDLWKAPELIAAQPEAVKAETAKRFNWEARRWALEHKYFHPSEVIVFANYSLAEAERYTYHQTPQPTAVANGLFTINREYRATSARVFGLSKDGWRMTWQEQPLRNIPLAYRVDGYSLFYFKENMTPGFLEEHYVDCFRGTDVQTLIWGVGPGSVLCYDTRVGQRIGDGVDASVLAKVRKGDLRAVDNVANLIASGNDPLSVVAERSRRAGLEFVARLPLNHKFYKEHKYGNFRWAFFVGNFAKQHPELAIEDHVNLDFRHQAVRDYKKALIREIMEYGVDGFELDFRSGPPFFKDPDPAIMTQFLRDVREMSRDIEKRQGRPIRLHCKLPIPDPEGLGLDWKTWMKEELIDSICPFKFFPPYFDLDIEEFVSLGRRTGCKVYGQIWFGLGLVDSDPRPGDEDKGITRYCKPKTDEMFYAQALLYQRQGVDGIDLAMSADQWHHMPCLHDLGDPAKLEFADKHYMMDFAPVDFYYPGHIVEGTFRFADDIKAAGRAGYDGIQTTLILYTDALEAGETLTVLINGKGPIEFAGGNEQADRLVDMNAERGRDDFMCRPDWWQHGEHRAEVPADYWRLAENSVQIRYDSRDFSRHHRKTVRWIDVIVRYGPPAAS